jgi:UDP-N-acetylenolpyruvoylglucosamine reductase
MDVRTLLNAALPGKILVPSDKSYETSNNTYFTVFENALKPAFIAQPTTTAEVSSLLKALAPLLENQQVSLAIRGTGHTPFAGSANIDNGVTIDMRGLKGITLSDDKSTVEICAGETWASVYTALEEHGLTTAGGRVGRVGVGGLVLGGTYPSSPFTSCCPKSNILKSHSRRSLVLLHPQRLRLRFRNAVLRRPRIR